jgi:uncharacterized protein
MTQIDRRSFLRNSVLLAGGAAVMSPVAQLLQLHASGASATGAPAQGGAAGYGPLSPKAPVFAGPGADPNVQWLSLPEGFDYSIFGVDGVPMSDGNVTPFAHDGMGAYPAGHGKVRLVRNHEVRDNAGVVAPPSPMNVYDPKSGGGNTTVEIEFDQGVPKVGRDFVSLSGTHTNCAGGVTPWGSWITCEETTVGAASSFGQEHGYAFAIPSSANEPVAPTPLKALGRFDHEAVCVDPRTGIVYETEDNGDSGFFRFVPRRYGDLSTGKLQMLKVVGVTNYDTRTGQEANKPLQVEWVDIDQPDPPGGGSKTVYNEGFGKGGAIFRRLEGCWFQDDHFGGSVFFNSTDGGDARHGQVWEFRPQGSEDGKLQLVFEAPDSDTLSFPDNLNVTPRGGIILCEDTSRPPIALPFSEQYLKGLDRKGQIFDFALNIVDNKEWAGACWSPDGRYLFVNTQGKTRTTDPHAPSRTYAIWGPWHRGPL